MHNIAHVSFYFILSSIILEFCSHWNNSCERESMHLLTTQGLSGRAERVEIYFIVLIEFGTYGRAIFFDRKAEFHRQKWTGFDSRLTHLSMFGWLSLFISWTSLSIFGLFAASWFILSTITWLVTLWVTWKNETNMEVSDILRYAVALLLTLDHTTGAYVTVPILCVTNFAKVTSTRTLFLQYCVILWDIL